MALTTIACVSLEPFDPSLEQITLQYKVRDYSSRSKTTTRMPNGCERIAHENTLAREPDTQTGLTRLKP